MKRMIATVLIAAVCLTMLAGCGAGKAADASAPAHETQNTEAMEGKEVLNGKKVIFIGNSFTWYGKCVLDKGQSEWMLDKRTNDQGYFYQVCKANGVDVSVTNFTFGGHQLKDYYRTIPSAATPRCTAASILKPSGQRIISLTPTPILLIFSALKAM